MSESSRVLVGVGSIALVFIVLWLWVGMPPLEKEPLKYMEPKYGLYEVRTGLVTYNHQYQRIIVQTIDGGRTWLLITPTRTVKGYLRKALPRVNPDSLEKVSPIDNGLFNNNNFKFYYDWL